MQFIVTIGLKLFIAVFFLLILSCTNHNNSKMSGSETWIKGNEEEKLKTIETQFRGFEMAMVETGYRYTELY